MNAINFVSGSLLLSLVSSHSFLECSDYRGTINGQDWDDDSCYGYPRRWAYQRTRYDFGTTGEKSNRLDSESGAFCKYDFDGFDDDQMYDEDYPYANYTVGSTIRLVWPAENHANYECNGYIRDYGLELYVNPTKLSNGVATDPTDLTDWNLVFDWHAEAEANGYDFGDKNIGIDGIPFQNCPDFCEDTANAPCFGDFTLTSAIFNSAMGGEPGIYTFMWLWRFSTELTIYTTCYEAAVSTDGTVITLTDTNTDTNTDSGTDTDTGNSDEDGNSNTNEDEETVYVVTIPVCYNDGNGYDEDTLAAAFETVANKVNGQAEFEILTVFQNDAGDHWNTSVESNELESLQIEQIILYMAANGTMCQIIEDAFDNVGSCSICGGASAKSYEAASTSSSSETDDSTMLGVAFIVVAILLAGLIIFAFYKRHKDSKNVTTGKPAENAMAAHIGTATNVRVVSNEMDGPPPVPAHVTGGATGTGTGGAYNTNAGRPGGRPPRPPPPRPTY